LWTPIGTYALAGTVFTKPLATRIAASSARIWRLAATRIESYRIHAGITDPTTALGPLPDDLGQHAQHQAFTEFLASTVPAIDTLDRPGPPDPNDDEVACLELP
jgi:hypothetical protein